MSRQRSFVDSHAYFHAFVGNRLDRAVQLMNEQSGRVLSNAGIVLPPQSASCLVFIAEKESASAADIAAALDLPHQLVAQRLNALMGRGLVVRRADPNDGRRKILRLTPKGKTQIERLNTVLHDTNAVYEELNKELGVDVSALALRLIDTLDREPLEERILRRQARARKKAG